MASSYGYVKREVQDMQINWAEVGQNVRSVLDEESRVRQEKKDAFEKQAREYEQRVTNPDLLGKDTEFNEGVLKFGADAQEMSMMNSMLLKSGQLKPRDYTIKTQNMIDGTNDVFKVIEMYNNLSEEVMAKVDSGDLSSDNLENFAMVQDFANFNDNRIIFNPYSGKVNVATMVEDPDNPGGPLIPSKDLRSVQSLGNILKDQVAKYKFFDKTTEYAKKLGLIVEQSIKSYGGIYQKGTIEKITNVFLKRPGGLEELSSDEKKKIAADLGIDENEVMMIHSAIGTWAESQVVSDRDGMSILVDFLGTTPDGETYKAVFNEEDAFDDNGNRKENIILKTVENGRLIYELTDEQKIAAKRTLVRQLSSELQASTEIVAEQIFKEESTPTESDENAAVKLDAQKLWNEMWSASPERKAIVMQALLQKASSYKKGILSIEPTDDGLAIQVEYDNSKKNTTINFDENISKEDWAKLGEELTGLGDPEKQFEAGGFGDNSNLGGTSFMVDGKKIYVRREGARGLDDNLTSYLDDNLFRVVDKDTGKVDDKKSYLQEGQSAVAEKLTEKFSKDLGITALPVGIGLGDEVKVTVKGYVDDKGNPISFDLDCDFSDVNKAITEERRFDEWLNKALRFTGRMGKIPVKNEADKPTEEDTGGGASDATKGDDIITK